jgi:putative colanic acid biosynthesis UDP-glucose lipid carrier transferase
VNTARLSPKTNKRLLQNHDTLIVWVQQLFNAVIIIATLLGLAYWHDSHINDHYRYMAIISVLTMLIVYRHFGVYRRFQGRIRGVQQLARSWGVVVIIVGWASYITQTTEEYSRQVIFIWAVLAFFLQAWIFPLFYWAHKSYVTKYSNQGVPSFVIGTEEIAKHLTTSINRNIWLPEKIIGIIATNEEDKLTWHHSSAAIVGTIDNLEELIKKYKVRRIYIALPLRLSHLIEGIQDLLLKNNIDLIWAPDIFSLQLLNPSVREMAGIPLVTLSESPLMAGGPAFIKNVFDKVIASLAIICLSPILIATAIAIKLNSSGPVIFKQKRHGWDGKVFNVWKFRSMYVHEIKEGTIKQATTTDPRITKIGRFIRKTSIDELPQLFNVLKGTMSLVGPRPHAVEHNNFYSDKVSAYLSRHRIKPGITGLAQVNGLRGETETLDKMEKRIEYDLEYINNWSPWVDLKILVRTPVSLLTQSAY